MKFYILFYVELAILRVLSPNFLFEYVSYSNIFFNKRNIKKANNDYSLLAFIFMENDIYFINAS